MPRSGAGEMATAAVGPPVVEELLRDQAAEGVPDDDRGHRQACDELGVGLGDPLDTDVRHRRRVGAGRPGDSPSPGQPGACVS